MLKRMPSQSFLKSIVLFAIYRNGGRATTEELYKQVAVTLHAHPDLMTLATASGDNKFKNNMRWARKKCEDDEGWIYTAQKGIYILTPKGLDWLFEIDATDRSAEQPDPTKARSRPRGVNP